MMAQELTSEHLGKKIQFQHGRAEALTTYTDVLVGVKHHQNELGPFSTAQDILSFRNHTRIWLKNTQWRTQGLLSGMSEDRGLEVASDLEITIIDDK